MTACCASLWAGSAGMSLLLCRFLGIPLTPDFGSHPSDASFSQYLLAIAIEMRLQMHTSWLILGAFGTLGLAGLMWVGAEKMQQKSEWNRQDVTWMVGFAAALFASAIFYRAATQGALSRKFALSGGVADMFAISVAVAVPIVLWYRWHKPPQEAKPREKDEEESFSSSHYSRTILGLHDYSPPPAENRIPETKETPAAAAPVVMQPPPAIQPSEAVATMADKQPEPAKEQIPAIEPIPAKAQMTEPIKNEAIGMENMTILNLDAQPLTAQPATTQPTAPTPASQSATTQAAAPEPVMSQQFTPQPAPTPMPAPQAMPAQSWMSQPPAPERSAVPAAGFREQLIALNLSWQRIEESGKELEDWFQRQHRRVFAHLERPSARSQDTHMEVSRDFLEQRMDRVDAEWSAIHRTVRDMYRWLENGNASAERVEVPQEPKVW